MGTKEKILELFDPANDHKLELQASVREMKEAILQGKKENPDNENLEELSKRLQALNTDTWEQINEADEPVERGLRIFSGNSVQVCEVSAIYSSTEGALYHHISQVNHSCNPNAVWSWVLDDFRRKQVRAVKNIRKGEEILINYVDTQAFNYGTRDYRRDVLVDKFSFICRCSECSLEGDMLGENEKKRQEVVRNLEQVKELMAKFKERSTMEAMKLGTSTVGLVRGLGLVYEVPRVLLNCYQMATAARYQNILGVVNPTVFSDQALSYCRQFGDSFMYFYDFVCKPL